jgi:hypothetical protein
MDLNPESRRILALAKQGRTPDPADKARVEARLTLALGASVTAVSALAASHAVASSASLSAKSAAGYALLKWWIGGAALLAAVGGSYFLLPVTQVQRAQPPAVRASPPPSSSATKAEPTADERLPPATNTAASVKPAQLDAHGPTRRLASAMNGPLNAELALLHRAQAAWRDGESRRALVLLKQHAQRFPRSALRLERDALQILNLCEVGDKAQGRRLAQELLARAPQSPLRTSIEQSCSLK